MQDAKPARYRSIWISDVHLGTPGCKAELLADFLKANDCETLYLVGDIIDGWKLTGGWYWPQQHTNVVRKILTKAKRGTTVYYVTGNHDEFLRRYVGFGLTMGNIHVVDEHVHVTADGRRLLVLHGDAFDVITRYHRWVAAAGDLVYETAMRVNELVNSLRRRVGKPYWSLSAYAKQRVRSAAEIVATFEESVARECVRRGLDGVVCGHIHHAANREIQGIEYMNCGDWVESCTALAERPDGTIEILRWLELENAHEVESMAQPLFRAQNTWAPPAVMRPGKPESEPCKGTA
jgi:UDP-2,3-diacylglucosamine pyrophosphatase LpxH